jgi:hypothetical protein
MIQATLSSLRVLPILFKPSSGAVQSWWLVFLVSLGLLLLIWSTRNRLNWSFPGLPGCTGEVTVILGTVFSFVLMIVGIAGVFYSRTLLWLDRGLFVFENLVSAWELIFGAIFLALILYFIVAARVGIKGLGCGSIILLILAADYLYFTVAFDRWRTVVEPLTNLFQLFRGG